MQNLSDLNQTQDLQFQQTDCGRHNAEIDARESSQHFEIPLLKAKITSSDAINIFSAAMISLPLISCLFVFGSFIRLMPLFVGLGIYTTTSLQLHVFQACFMQQNYQNSDEETQKMLLFVQQWRMGVHAVAIAFISYSIRHSVPYTIIALLNTFVVIWIICAKDEIRDLSLFLFHFGAIMTAFLFPFDLIGFCSCLLFLAVFGKKTILAFFCALAFFVFLFVSFWTNRSPAQK